MTRAACPRESSGAGFDGVKTASAVLVDGDIPLVTARIGR
jgi:hypothetical protein